MAGVSANRNQRGSGVCSARKKYTMLTVTIVKKKKYNAGEVPEEQLAKILYVILKGFFCNCPRSLFFINA